MRVSLAVLASAIVMPFAKGDVHDARNSTETTKTNLRGGVHDTDLDINHIDENDVPPEVLQNMEDFMFSHYEPPHDHHSSIDESHHSIHHGHHHLEGSHHHHADPEHFGKHQAVEDHHLHHRRAPHRHESSQKVILPTGFDSHYNQTLYHRLLDAPFDIYESIFDHHIWGESSFPVFAVPEWSSHATGLFSSFGKSGDSLIFENLQFLLKWHDILEASDGVTTELYDYMSHHDFHANLIIGKAHQEKDDTAHIALVVSYYQFGSRKHVLVPFARIEDFFDNASVDFLKDPDTKDLETSALKEMIYSKRSSNNTSSFFSAAAMNATKDEGGSGDRREEAMGIIEGMHFQKLFQLLIRRTFLFSFGYADCLMQEEPGFLRQCLDDTYSSVVKMETNVRGALDDQVVEQLAVVNGQLHTKLAEACVDGYSSGSCDDHMMMDLGTLATTPSFMGKLLQHS